ncbi:MAG: S8 family serine peptidase, partial [Bacteroidetes bacterium]|nr:S8 family serine peptidase [Bacteroidota bacterium]
MRVQAFFTSIFLLCCCFGNAQSWQSKIDRGVLQKVTAGENVDCIVVLAEQADVSEAAFLPKKKDKGGFVFQKLVETAARTQVNVLKTLEDFQAPHLPFYVVNAVRVERGNLPLLEALARLPEVGRIDPNPLVHFQEPDKDENPGGSRAIEWNVTHINAEDVWAMGFNGTGTVVAGEDTGYDWDHPALQNKYRGWNGSSADHNYNWHDAIHAIDPHNSGPNPCGLNSAVPCDDNNHGTHTMGTMAGDDGAGNQIGVAPGAKWIGCRNMERGWGMPSTYLECFEWFLAPTNLAGNSPQPALAPDVINNSWGCPASEGCNSGNFYILETAIDNLHSAGVMVVASAGNSGSNCSSVADPPAIYENSFSVGATNIADDIASFSSRGPVTADGSNRLKPNISAPGVNIRSSVNGGGYQSGWSGTSMAGPHVAAVVALMLDANPNLTMLQIENILESTAVDRTSAQTCGGVPGSNIPNNTYGYGIVDALAAVNDALGLLPVELIDFQGHVQGAAVRLDWEVAPEGSLNHFEVEHADSRLDWTTFGKQLFLPGMEFYHQLDDHPVPGLNYYRLKMVDIDGSIEYSKVIVVQLAENEGLVTYPNPVRQELLLSATWETGAVEVRIFDAAGRLVQQTQEQTTE